MLTRTLISALSGIVGFALSLDAQSIRISNAGAIPNGAMMPPTVLQSIPVSYTDAARIRGIQGTVTVEAEVNSYGQIRAARILRGLGFGLDEAALTSVFQWALSPATQNGAPVAVIAQIDVQFNLPAQLRLAWERVGIGDCTGHDVASSQGSVPDNNRAIVGYTAVCWDGSQYKNGNNKRAWCTYKNVAPTQCTEGNNTGIMYKGVGK